MSKETLIPNPILSDSNEYKKRAKENRRIFEEANLLSVLDQIACQGRSNRHMFVDDKTDENCLSMKLKVPFEYASKRFTVPVEEISTIKEECLTVVEIFLSTNNDLIVANDWYGMGGEGDREEIVNFILENTKREIRMESPEDIRKTKDTIVSKEAKNGQKRFNLRKLFFS